mmetsp:Transcript_8528/g.27195  ORF Transcript_8528/g.27195 Transcript_8528/m.27195 type:complete len:240 (-) Transcript_8528:410-1129(-)
MLGAAGADGSRMRCVTAKNALVQLRSNATTLGPSSTALTKSLTWWSPRLRLVLAIAIVWPTCSASGYESKRRGWRACCFARLRSLTNRLYACYPQSQTRWHLHKPCLTQCWEVEPFSLRPWRLSEQRGVTTRLSRRRCSRSVPRYLPPFALPYFPPRWPFALQRYEHVCSWQTKELTQPQGVNAGRGQLQRGSWLGSRCGQSIGKRTACQLRSLPHSPRQPRPLVQCVNLRLRGSLRRR